MSQSEDTKAFGEQSGLDATLNYQGSRKTINATVNAAELQAGIAKQRQDFKDAVAKHEEFKRVPKGQTTVKHKLPLTEEYLDGDSVKFTREKTFTTRKEN